MLRGASNEMASAAPGLVTCNLPEGGRKVPAIDFASVDPFLLRQIELTHHPKSDNCEMMIKRVRESYSCTLHDNEARADSGHLEA